MRRLAQDSGATQGEKETATALIAVLIEKYKISEKEIKETDDIVTHYERLDVKANWPRGLAAIIAQLNSVSNYISIDKLTNLTTGIVFVGRLEDVQKAVVAFRWFYTQILKLSQELRSRAEELLRPMPPITDRFGNDRSEQFAGAWTIFLDIGNTFGVSMRRTLPPLDSSEWKALVDSWGHGILLALAQRLIKIPDAKETKSNNSAKTGQLVPDDRANRVNEAERWFMQKFEATTTMHPVERQPLDPQYYHMGLADINKIMMQESEKISK